MEKYDFNSHYCRFLLKYIDFCSIFVFVIVLGLLRIGYTAEGYHVYRARACKVHTNPIRYVTRNFGFCHYSECILNLSKGIVAQLKS